MPVFRNHTVMIQLADGVREPFDPVRLQTKLIGCFLAAGRGEASYMAEDIALAVEFTLNRAPRPEPIFGIGELDAAVSRLLEETGFPDVAAQFSKESASSVVQVSAAAEPLSELLRRHLACSPERFERVIRQVLEAAQRLGIREASPHLYLELARYYEEQAKNLAPDLVVQSAAAVTLTAGEIAKRLPEEAQRLVDVQILRISGVTTLFPGLRIVFRIERFAQLAAWNSPVTELELEPQLYRIGAILEAARESVARQLPDGYSLPCILSIPDMFDFIRNYTGAVGPGAEKLALELGSVLSSCFAVELYKLSFN